MRGNFDILFYIGRKTLFNFHLSPPHLSLLSPFIRHQIINFGQHTYFRVYFFKDPVILIIPYLTLFQGEVFLQFSYINVPLKGFYFITEKQSNNSDNKYLSSCYI